MIHFNYRERAFGKIVGLFILSVFVLGITTTLLKGVIENGVLTGVILQPVHGLIHGQSNVVIIGGAK